MKSLQIVAGVSVLVLCIAIGLIGVVTNEASVNAFSSESVERIIVINDWRAFHAETLEATKAPVKLQAFQKKWSGKRVAFEAYIMEAVPKADGSGAYLIAPTEDTDSFDWEYASVRKGYFDASMPPKSLGAVIATIQEVNVLGAIYTDCEFVTIDDAGEIVPLTAANRTIPIEPEPPQPPTIEQGVEVSAAELKQLSEQPK